MRIVVKVGTSTLAYGTGRLNIRHTEQLVKVLSDLKNEGHEVILVSSGAIGMGVGKLSLPQRPKDTASKQACAAVGQCELMYTYDRLFNAYNHTVAQILLTGVDVEHTDRRVNFQTTLNRLLELGALPIINENDTVATDEITSIGDNDTLAAIVACCCKADLLVLLSDIDGLYTANPHTHPDAALIPLVEEITPEVMALADGAGSALGTGGMATKLSAARIAMESGSGGVEYVRCAATGKCWFPVMQEYDDGTRQAVTLPSLYALNEDGLYNLLIREDCLVVYSGEETDFGIGASKMQNGTFLLKAVAGNLYQHPTTGVGLIDFLHSNMENNGLAAKLQAEFGADKVVIKNAYIDSATGELLLETEEKEDNHG